MMKTKMQFEHTLTSSSVLVGWLELLSSSASRTSFSTSLMESSLQWLWHRGIQLTRWLRPFLCPCFEVRLCGCLYCCVRRLTLKSVLALVEMPGLHLVVLKDSLVGYPAGCLSSVDTRNLVAGLTMMTLSAMQLAVADFVELDLLRPCSPMKRYYYCYYCYLLLAIGYQVLL